jgi:hypothetical protein
LTGFPPGWRGGKVRQNRKRRPTAGKPAAASASASEIDRNCRKRRSRNRRHWSVVGKVRLTSPALVKDTAETASLQTIRTRLNEFSECEQGPLINWGYALTDAAM